MDSRNRPAQGPISDDPETALDAVLGHAVRKTTNDIPVSTDGFSHATTGERSESRIEDAMKLHQVLRQLMLRKNESARAAAKSCGVPLSTFSSYLKHKKQIDPHHIIAIAAHYAVSVDYLLTGKRPDDDAFKRILTKKIFSKWVKVTIEDLIDEGGTDEASPSKASEK